MKHSSIILLLILFAINVDAQQLSLLQCRDMALQSNRQLKIAQSELKKSSYEAKSLKSNYFPNLSANGLYFYTDQKLKLESAAIPLNTLLTIPSLGADLNLANSYHAGLTLSQPLYMGGKIRSGNKMAKIGQNTYAVNEKKSRMDIIQECDEAYLNCVKAEQMVKLSQQYKTTVESLLNDINNAFNIGMIAQNDVLKVKVKLNEALLNELKAKNASRIATMNLCQIIGINIHSIINVDTTIINDNDSNTTFDFNVANRPEYQMLSNQVELYNEKIKLTRSNYLPNAAILLGYGYTNAINVKGTNDFSKALLGNGTKLMDSFMFSAMATINIPIFHWGEGNNKVRAAKEDKFIADLKRKELSEKMELEANIAFNNLNEAKMEVELTTSSLAQAEENLRISNNQYKQGMETLSNLLEAQTSWQQAVTNVISAKTSLKLATTNYLKSIGEL